MLVYSPSHTGRGQSNNTNAGLDPSPRRTQLLRARSTRKCRDKTPWTAHEQGMKQTQPLHERRRVASQFRVHSRLTQERRGNRPNFRSGEADLPAEKSSGSTNSQRVDRLQPRRKQGPATRDALLRQMARGELVPNETHKDTFTTTAPNQIETKYQKLNNTYYICFFCLLP